MTREELRVAVQEALNKSNNIAIQAATGSGKSKVALELLCELASRKLNPLKALIVVAERAHIDNWDAEMIKWNLPFGDATIICYASLKKYRDTKWDAIIFDEAHHLGSELRLDIFDTISADYRIFLSATLKNSLVWRLQQSCGRIESVKMGLQEAFESNILPEPKIILIPMTLNNTVSNNIITEEWGKSAQRVTLRCYYKDRWKYLRAKKQYPNAKLEILCTEQQHYDYLSEQFEYYKNRYFSCRNEAIKNKWLQCGSKRKRLLGLLKTFEASALIESKLANKRFICFCTSIEQADYLGGDSSVHSKKKESLSIIQDFNDKKINNLFAVGMLQEGMNLTDIEAGVIIQLDGEERAFIQRFGRVLRSDSPVQYILYYKGTRDEEYLANALEGIDKKYITEI